MAPIHSALTAYPHPPSASTRIPRDALNRARPVPPNRFMWLFFFSGLLAFT